MTHHVMQHTARSILLASALQEHCGVHLTVTCVSLQVKKAYAMATPECVAVSWHNSSADGRCTVQQHGGIIPS